MKNIIYFVVIFLLFSCKDEQVKPQPNIPTLPIDEEIPKTSVFKGFTIDFSTDSAIISEGDTFTSVSPIFSTSISGIVYFLQNSTIPSFVNKGKFNQIELSRQVPNGIYVVDAQVFKETRDTLFKNVFQLTVTSSLVKEVKYKESSIVLTTRKDLTVNAPIYFGTKPATFYISTEPNMPSISINNQTGAIIIAKSVLPGNYVISITTKNSQGFASFNSIMNISVGGVLDSTNTKISYSEVIEPIISINCKRCHPGYEKYSNAFNVAESIYDRVSRPLGSPGKMPQSGSLSEADIALIKKWIDTGKNP